MAKKFFEVFPTLKLDAKMKDLFEQVMVEKVSATRRRDLIRVTIVSDYLITKEIIFKVEKEIKKQFFSTYDVTVKLYEKFHLSEQYNPEKLMEAYRDSILLELRDYSPIEYNLFKGADIEFCGEKEMILTIEDSVPAHSKAYEVSRILEKILNERCGFSIDCRIVYKEKETD
ncbi:MAG: PolC-type DNA polymerase III, partial [Lachnospiraceae bacterium]|nr:PolC-type DNA polymerase III [Lachnospiraceae bacterium]